MISTKTINSIYNYVFDYTPSTTNNRDLTLSRTIFLVLFLLRPTRMQITVVDGDHGACTDSQKIIKKKICLSLHSLEIPFS